MEIIDTKNLTKEYSSGTFSKEKILALDSFTFKVNQGEIFGLLGPNGAGKTTLVKLLLNITFPTKGNAKIFNRDISNVNIKEKIGYLPENHKFPSYLTGEQALYMFGRLSGLDKKNVKSRTNNLFRLVDLEKWMKTKVKKYSKGMTQRLGLAQALINNPELIFLDEPTDGVDPIGRKEIRDVLLNLRDSGKTIFLNSHLLSEVELICDRVAILNKGVLIMEGNVDDILTSSDDYLFITSDMNSEVTNYLLNKYKTTIISNNQFKLKAKNIEELNELIDYLRSKSILIHSVAKEKNSLENMFINLIAQQDKTL